MAWFGLISTLVFTKVKVALVWHCQIGKLFVCFLMLLSRNIPVAMPLIVEINTATKKIKFILKSGFRLFLCVENVQSVPYIFESSICLY